MQRKNKKLSNRLAKDEKRYQKALSKYEKVSSRSGNIAKIQKYQNAEQEARARRNKTAAKLDSVKAGRQATTKLMSAYANSPTAVSKLKKTAIDKGSKTIKNLLSNTRIERDTQRRNKMGKAPTMQEFRDKANRMVRAPPYQEMREHNRRYNI